MKKNLSVKMEPIIGIAFFFCFIALRIPKIKKNNIPISIIINDVLIIGVTGDIIIEIVLNIAPNSPSPNDCFRWYFTNKDLVPL